MTVSRVNPFSTTPFEEDTKRTQDEQNDQRRSSRPTTSPPPAGANTSVRQHLNAPRANLLANNARAVNGGKVARTASTKSTGATWNKGMTLACELVQALTAPRDDEDGSAGRPLHAFVEIIRPLATLGKAPTAAGFLADAIGRLRTGGLPEQNADLLQRLKDLQADKDDALGFYAVMVVMAAGAGIADLIADEVKGATK